MMSSRLVGRFTCYFGFLSSCFFSLSDFPSIWMKYLHVRESEIKLNILLSHLLQQLVFSFPSTRKQRGVNDTWRTNEDRKQNEIIQSIHFCIAWGSKSNRSISQCSNSSIISASSILSSMERIFLLFFYAFSGSTSLPHSASFQNSTLSFPYSASLLQNSPRHSTLSVAHSASLHH